MAIPALPRDSYSVGIICALDVEKAAVEATLDEEHSKVQKLAGDDNVYSFGRIGVHNVVIACLPAGVMGTVSATAVAKDMLRSFPIKAGLMVGIGGGVWSEKTDVRLGDVVVSQPDGMHGGVVQWDFGKMEREGMFRRTGTLNKPPQPLLNAVQSLKATHRRKGSEVHRHVEEMLARYPLMQEDFGHQGREHDELFEASYCHSGGDDCKGCDRSRLVRRLPERKDDRPKIHYGNIASADEVVKDGPTRDRIAREEGALCFEMEAAGLMDAFPCVVIRGICDYADSHKNKRWQPYAAATAACYAKELLGVVDRQGVENLGPVSDTKYQVPFDVRGQQQNLKTDLIKLGKLSTSLRSRKNGPSAHKIADRLATLITCLRDSSPSCSPHNHNEYQWAALGQSLKDCERITINSGCPNLPQMTVARVNRQYDSCDLEQGTLGITTLTKHARDEHGNEVVQALSTLRFQPSLSGTGSPFVAFFGGQIDAFQKSVIYPTILAYRNISSDSDVFGFIEMDDLEGFQKLLLAQEATIRDCDERGCSLLNYACFFGSPMCCKFLIESGADVNFLEPSINTLLQRGTTALIAHPDSDEYMDGAELSQSLLCRKLLLQAGADPTITLSDGDSTIEQAIGTSYWVRGSTAALDLIIRYANEYYIDWKRLTIHGQSIWLYACSNAWFLQTPMILDSLMAAGCNVAEIDDQGWNCLFRCVLFARHPKSCKELQALVHLLKRFPDILAKDYAGMTVFDHARDTSGLYGSYRRDLLTTALARAGYSDDKPSIRHAVYTPQYLPEHHLAMRHLHSWAIIIDAYDLISLTADRWSFKREALQIMARIHYLSAEISKLKKVPIMAQTIRIGMIRPSMRPQVAAATSASRSITKNGKTLVRDHRFFRTVRMTR